MNKFSLIFIILIVLGFMFCFVGGTGISENIEIGVVFSQKQSKLLGLDWKKNYSELLNIFNNINIKTSWDLIEKENNIFSFKDLDLQVNQAHGKKIMLTIGDCDLPQWTESLGQDSLNYIHTILLRYEDSPNIFMWELGFDDCLDKDLINRQIEFIRNNSKKPINTKRFIVSKKIYIPKFDLYIPNLLNPAFYNRKSFLMDKNVVVEIQGQPIGKIYEMSEQEQERFMDLELFKRNLEFAKKTGLNTFCISGGEWWYLLKTRYKKSEILDFVESINK